MFLVKLGGPNPRLRVRSIEILDVDYGAKVHTLHISLHEPSLHVNDIGNIVPVWCVVRK